MDSPTDKSCGLRTLDLSLMGQRILQLSHHIWEFRRIGFLLVVIPIQEERRVRMCDDIDKDCPAPLPYTWNRELTVYFREWKRSLRYHEMMMCLIWSPRSLLYSSPIYLWMFIDLFLGGINSVTSAWLGLDIIFYGREVGSKGWKRLSLSYAKEIRIGWSALDSIPSYLHGSKRKRWKEYWKRMISKTRSSPPDYPLEHCASRNSQLIQPDLLFFSPSRECAFWILCDSAFVLSEVDLIV